MSSRLMQLRFLVILLRKHKISLLYVELQVNGAKNYRMSLWKVVEMWELCVLQLLQDCETRWLATNLMVSRTIDLYPVSALSI